MWSCSKLCGGADGSGGRSCSVGGENEEVPEFPVEASSSTILSAVAGLELLEAGNRGGGTGGAEPQLRTNDDDDDDAAAADDDDGVEK